MSLINTKSKEAKQTFNEINNVINSKYDDNVTDDLSTKDLETVMDLLFKKQFTMYSHMYDSYNQFIDEMIVSRLKNGIFILDEEITIDNKIKRHMLKFSQISFHVPVEDTPDEPIMTPMTARIKNLTYASKLTTRVEQIIEITDIASGEKTETILYHDVIPIGKIPIMLRSAYCVTQPSVAPNIKNTECQFNPGCIFIVRGSEKVIISLEKQGYNYIYVFVKKDLTFIDKEIYTCQVNSIGASINSNLQICSIRMEKNMTIALNMTQITDIPIFIIMRALGIETDYDICKYIVYDMEDIDMLNIIKYSMNQAYEEVIKTETGEHIIVRTREHAIQYLITKITNRRKYSETDVQERMLQKRTTLMNILKNDLLHHLGTDEYSLIKKAYYLGYMIHRLLSCYLKRTPRDDRDSYVNKRVELPGVLLDQLFAQNLKKMINECSKRFKKKKSGDIYPNVIGQIQQNIIELGINKALGTGTWGSSKKKGVAQLLHCLTFPQSISYLRRIMTPSLDASNTKVLNMRHVDPHCYGYIDSIETPEGHKIGLVKSLALSAAVTLNMPLQVPLIKTILNNIGNEIEIFNFDIHPLKFKQYTKIFLNGEWLGMTGQGNKLVELFKKKRLHGEIHRHVSIIYNRILNEIRINTDGGRLIRPLLRVNNNKLIITKDIINKINLNNVDIPGKINSINQLLTEYPDIIEYIDIEESENILVAMYAKDIADNYSKMITPISNPQFRGDSVNRYPNLYKRYTHCEFHPMLQLGTISGSNVFTEHNQSPRNYYSFAQTKQAMGIYSTNYRHRADISYILYHSHLPLVISRGARYTDIIHLPSGENAIVAIQCYSGYNQEDSIIANATSIERGLYRATYFKRYDDVSKKNIQTTTDDEFGIKDKSLVKGINEKEKNYDKINEKGFAPEETVLYNGDILIGKVSQIADGDGKMYRDESQSYKSNVPGCVDKVWHNIYDGDGYPMIKMRIRSMRTPIVGDKFSCYDDKTDILTNNGWKSISKLEMTDKIATLQTKNTLEYLNPTKLYKYDYNGPMYYVNTEQINLFVTPSHRMFIADKHEETYNIMTAESIYGKCNKYLKNVDCFYTSQLTHFTLPAVNNLQDALQLPINEWLVIFGLWINEGYVINQNNTISISNNQIVDKSVLSDIRLISYLSLIKSKSNDISLPEWTWTLNKLQCQLLINHIVIDADYSTVSISLANDLQRLCLHAGWSCDIIKKNNLTKYNLRIYKHDNKPIVNDEQQQDKWIPFNGNVYCCTVPGDGVIYVRRNGKTSWSCNSRHGQKGTIGVTLRSEDMPFTKDGIQPDLIIHPCCIPSRMTIGQLFECCTAKASALIGKITDATPFNKISIEDINRILKSYGFSENGNETLYCGFTGKKINTQIFIGPVYYLRLKHMVSDKIHSRAKGPRQLLTKQPPEGRALNGGLRFGEMERDAVIGHGMGQFLKERLVDTSDIYYTHVCIRCGIIATKMINKNAYFCSLCKKTEICKTVMPYAYKLLTQELMAINILAKINLDIDEYTTQS